jgi:hypothetical protein
MNRLLCCFGNKEEASFVRMSKLKQKLTDFLLQIVNFQRSESDFHSIASEKVHELKSSSRSLNQSSIDIEIVSR